MADKTDNEDEESVDSRELEDESVDASVGGKKEDSSEKDDREEVEDSSADEPNSKKKPRGCFFRLFQFFCILFLLGLIGSGIFLYVIGKKYLDKAAPHNIADVAKLETGALVLDANKKRIGRAGAVDRIPIKYDDLPDHFVHALIAAEDHRYMSHPGFDLPGMVRAVIVNYRANKVREGASTLTQQLARNVFELQEKSIDRKLTEIALAWKIEQAYSKEEILEHYLNRIYFGSGFHGVGAAAMGFFGKPVSELNVSESALICGVIRSPSRFSPLANLKAAEENRDRTLQRMRELEFIDDATVKQWSGQPTQLGKPGPKGQSRYLLNQVENEARAILGKEASFDKLTIETSINLEFQKSAVAALNDHLNTIEKESSEFSGKPGDLQGAFFLIENKSGAILSAVGSRNFSKSEFDRVWGLRRPTGSAFLPFVYATAFEKGIANPLSEVLDAPVDNREVMLGGTDGILGEWSTESESNRWEGPIPAARALALSKNSPTARLGFQVGLEAISEMARATGIDSPLRDFASTHLGASEIQLPELVRAYSVFPNGGIPTPKPGFILKITDANENILYSREATNIVRKSKPVLSPENAATITSLLALDRDSEGNILTAGRSGTTSGYTDSWFAGFNSHYTWGVWVGLDQFKTIFPKAYGTKTAKPIWDTFKEKLKTETPIPQPEEMVMTDAGAGIQVLISAELAARITTPPPENEDSKTEIELASQDADSEENSEDKKGEDSPEKSEKPEWQPLIPALVGPDPYQSLTPESP